MIKQNDFISLVSGMLLGFACTYSYFIILCFEAYIFNSWNLLVQSDGS